MHLVEIIDETTSAFRILKLKPANKEQQLDYPKVNVGFVA